MKFRDATAFRQALEQRLSLFEDLQAEGPFAPIFRDFRNPEQPTDWLGG